MRRTLITIAAGASLGACGLFGAQDAQNAIDVESYREARNTCVVEASSRDAGLECFARVEAEWCGDGGKWHDAQGVCR